ncbi:DivIVA domain-containing protein [Micromonospora zingiberis]|uniref:DivIVA domain-containing protein n=1 Tax=Micromonospora zingiberis TaxID=2053011 RepID=A0A4R0G6L4_9ACTN|nr:DivIVA domain-containing protein [Micromonospora zingiberis]TCB90999.1 DivIVA domain-containing protein [Micromonospora zingiberis]
MELTRIRPSLPLGVILLLLGPALLWWADSPTVMTAAVAVAAVVFGVRMVTAALRPFRFRIGADGLDLRVAGLNRMVPWHEIDAIVLSQPAAVAGSSPSLLLVPATGAVDRPLTGRSPIDGREGLALLDLGTVRQPAAEVAAALARFGGRRFLDARQHPTGLELPSFTISLRGYDMRRVDELVELGQTALASGVPAQRSAIKTQIDTARTALPPTLRGYYTAEVDAYLDRLSAELAGEPGVSGGGPG